MTTREHFSSVNKVRRMVERRLMRENPITRREMHTANKNSQISRWENGSHANLQRSCSSGELYDAPDTDKSTDGN